MTPGACVLGAFALALVGAAAAMLGGAEPVVLEPVLAVVIPPRPPTALLPGDLDARWAVTALTRPLFSLDRRPAPPTPLAQAASLPSPPRLTGTMIGPFGRRALFAGGLGGDKPAAVGENDRIGIWTVQAIAAGLVTLTGPDGVRELRVGAEGDRSARADMAASSQAAPHWANPCGRSHLRRAAKPSAVEAGHCVLAAGGLPTTWAFP